jgi:hypothetical protein
MKTGTKWGIGLGVGIPGVLILIGLIGLLVKFFMKRCRKKAWNDIRTLPKDLVSVENDGIDYRKGKHTSSDRQPLYQPEINNAMEESDAHITIPIDDSDIPPSQRGHERTKEHDHTLVQIQRDRLNRLKDEENRLRPMIRLSYGENDIQHVIEQAQKEFDESV